MRTGMEGEVVAGRGVGSKQTVPTLNLATTAEVIPGDGVYITRTRDLEDGREWHSDHQRRLPAHLRRERSTDDRDLPAGSAGRRNSARIRVEFLQRVRAERSSTVPRALRAQILKDVRAAQSYFRRAKAWTGRECISC